MHRCLCLKQLLPDQAVSDAQTAQPCMTAYYNYHNTYDSAFTGLCKLAHSWGHVSEVHSIKETMHRSAFELCCSIQQARSCLWSARRLPFVKRVVATAGARLGRPPASYPQRLLQTSKDASRSRAGSEPLIATAEGASLQQCSPGQHLPVCWRLGKRASAASSAAARRCSCTSSG